MNRLCASAGLVVVVLGVLSVIQGANYGSDDSYNQMVIIKGKVEILNHPELGRTPGNGFDLLFQRQDCRRCVIGTIADAEGKYTVRVGRGRYKLIVENPSPPVVDLLAPEQPRFIDANSAVQDNQFDIKVVLPYKR